jgi:hypothetical protein
MKKTGAFALILLFSACNNSSGLSEKIDSLSKKIDSGADKISDSITAGAKRLKEKIDDKLDRKDTIIVKN